MSTNAPLNAEHYWTADQLRVMRGLELPAWFSPVAHVAVQTTASAAQADQALVDQQPLIAPAVPVLDISAADLPGLAQAIANCQACAFGRSGAVCRKPLALNPTQTAAQWLIVIDDKGQGTDLLSQDEHRLLGNMLAAVGKGWDSVSVTTLLKCANTSQTMLDAFSAQVQACQPFLNHYIALIKPQLIIAMGELAAQALLGVDDELAVLRGDMHEMVEYEGLPLLLMQHPGALLRQSELKLQAWRDLCSV